MGVNGAYVGGNANNGANDGFAYVNHNNSPANTNANIGSRLSRKIIVIWFTNTPITLPLGKKSRR